MYYITRIHIIKGGFEIFSYKKLGECYYKQNGNGLGWDSLVVNDRKKV